MDNQKLTEAVIALTAEIGELKGEVGVLQGAVKNGLTSTVMNIQQTVDTFMANRMESCPVRQREKEAVNTSRLKVAIIGLLIALVVSIPSWIMLYRALQGGICG